MDALEKILIPYAIHGVSRDLQRLAKSKALLVADDGKGNHPPLRDVLPEDGSTPKTLPAGYTLANVSSDDAYARYFDWYITPVDVGGGVSGVDAFYKRYPLLGYAIETVAAHHRDNIKLACERVAENWDDIRQAFFPGKPLKLKQIRTTGNDFHKGGKQVLILTFDLGGEDEGRIVYKPSAVEIDCRIVGDSSVFDTVKPGGYEQEHSLSELINSFTRRRWLQHGLESKPLPTYKILPYNRTSVPDSYGYIEYLSHWPGLDDLPLFARNDRDSIPATVGSEIQKLMADPKTQGLVLLSDWITEDASEAQVFYHQFGGLMAMAMSVSLCDLHLQNLIVHDRAPYLIDLEDAIKFPMSRVPPTMLMGADNSPIGNFHDPESPELRVLNDRTSDLMAVEFRSPGDNPAACVLYIANGPAAPGEPARLDRGAAAYDLRKAAIRGFVDVIEALAEPANNDAVKAWARGLDQTIARYVTRATADYASRGRAFYQSWCGSSIRPGAPASAYGAVKFTDGTGTDQYFFRAEVSAARTKFGGASRGDDEWDWPPAPYFACEHADHAWRDYLNCDVPSFYHRLGSTDLLNTKGDRVDVDAARMWQDANIPNAGGLPNGWKPNPNGAYLPETPVDMAVAQLDRLRNACISIRSRRAFIQAALAGTGLEADFTRLSAPKPRTGAAAVGARR